VQHVVLYSNAQYAIVHSAETHILNMLRHISLQKIPGTSP